MSHHDTFAHHVDDLAKDFLAHTPDEQQHLLEAMLEGGAGTLMRMTGNDAMGDMLVDMAKNDLSKGHLSFGDYGDIYKTVDHLV